MSAVRGAPAWWAGGVAAFLRFGVTPGIPAECRELMTWNMDLMAAIAAAGVGRPSRNSPSCCRRQ